jgi:hypothetical protein
MNGAAWASEPFCPRAKERDDLCPAEGGQELAALSKVLAHPANSFSIAHRR